MGGTPSRTTGPSVGPNGATSYYYYAETSGESPGQLFELDYVSECPVVASITFQYNMYGRTMGTLKVTTSDGADVWSLSGDQGNAWHQATVAVGAASFSFKYERGSSYTGDAAIGDVTVYCGSGAGGGSSGTGGTGGGGGYRVQGT